MGTHTCCNKQEVKWGIWSRDEDEKLRKYISTHGHGCWSSVPTLAGLQRCGKSCRRRWINYLQPGLKRGDFDPHEISTLIYCHKVLGNRWAHIAKFLPGRSDNEIRNFWNSHIRKNIQKFGNRNSSSPNHLQLLKLNNYSVPNAPPVFAPFESQMMNYRANLAPMGPPSCPKFSSNFQTTVQNIRPESFGQNDDFMFFNENSQFNSNPLVPNLGTTEKAKGVAFEVPPSFTSQARFVNPNEGLLAFDKEETRFHPYHMSNIEPLMQPFASSAHSAASSLCTGPFFLNPGPPPNWGNQE